MSAAAPSVEEDGGNATPANLASILAAEIECEVYETHVAPVLERLALAGLVLVPVRPTDAMLSAVDEEVGGRCYSCTKWRASDDDCRRVWAAMVGAAPGAAAAAPGPVPYDQHEREVLKLVSERDTHHEWADKLAAAIADHCQVDIGEHSSANNPWQEALDALTGTPAEMLSARLIDAWCASHGKQIPWAKAIEISAVIMKMDDAEKQRLLCLDESDEPTPGAAQIQGGPTP